MLGERVSETLRVRKEPERLLGDRWRSLIWLLLIVVSASLGAGCSQVKYARVRDNPLNPLAGPLGLLSRSGPKVTERTESLLRRYALEELYEGKPEECLERLVELAGSEPAAETTYAVAELSYILGKRAERLHQAGSALDYYSVCCSHAYVYLFSGQLDPVRNPYDPQFRGACDLYNGALESTLRLVLQHNPIRPGASYQVHSGKFSYEVMVVSRGAWREEDFAGMEFCSDYQIEMLDNRNETYGIGVPLIVRRSRPSAEDPAASYYPQGLAFPITAVLRVIPVDGGDLSLHGERHQCVLELYDPMEESDIFLADRRVPLQTDLSTPLAVFLDNEEFQEQTDSTFGLLFSNLAQENRGLFMLEPFDPNRIPVLMVHGLWSSPFTWMPMFNDLRSFPDLRRNYQFWFYHYPTGQPLWISAAQLREDLAQLRQQLDPLRECSKLDQMVLVGHSMGGLISHLQTMDSRESFWRVLSDAPFDSIEGTQEEVQGLASQIFFEPNPSIRRVVTIGSPHRGSEYANDYTRWLARKVISLPSTMTDRGHSIARKNGEILRNSDLLTTATSIDSLSPESPFFPAYLQATRSPSTRYHNILGLAQPRRLIQRWTQDSDGVVTLASGHLEYAESEIVVEAMHQNIHRTPRAILEVRRILNLHLATLRGTEAAAGQASASPPLPSAAPQPEEVPATAASDLFFRLPGTASSWPGATSTSDLIPSRQEVLFEGVPGEPVAPQRSLLFAPQKPVVVP
ncbi:MAG: esterase/lipase family protein [Pirellulaceae bacterium]